MDSTLSLTRLQVHLPPTRESNFVIHYQNTDYHSHTFVLQHHSVYFRNYFHALQPLREMKTTEVEEEVGVKDAEAGGKGKAEATLHREDFDQGHPKRRRVDEEALRAFSASFTRERSSKCQHSPLIPCIDLPDQCGVEEADEAEFLLFLRHLYFSSTFHLPPFDPKQSLVRCLTDETPVCLTFPTLEVKKESVGRYAKRNKTALFVDEGLLSLFHYFLCKSALKRCEEVVLADCGQDSYEAWYWLPLAERFRLTKAAAFCLDLMRKEWRQKGSVYLQEELKKLTPATQARVMRP